MNQSGRLEVLIKGLMSENRNYDGIPIPNGDEERKILWRSLVNVRRPGEKTKEYIAVQDMFLKEELETRGITDISELKPICDDIYLWQGDITTLKCDAIVNAANSKLTGCYVPMHKCIDNCIHTFAGMQLRNYCADIIKKQGHDEPVGSAKITPGFNLPCKYIIHTVGPKIGGALTDEDKSELESCYTSCLELADENELESIAICCISTGEFRFPHEEAARIAVATVKEYKQRTGSSIKVVFNVFKDIDRDIYETNFELFYGIRKNAMD